MGSRSRNGFTLVELLVVISIIGMLVALVLPAIQRSRESGRQSVCATHQKDLVVALQEYHRAYKRYPGYVNSIGNDSKQVSWVVVLFPYLDKQDLWENWRDRFFRNNAVEGWEPSWATHPHVYLENLVCPSNPPKGESFFEIHEHDGYNPDYAEDRSPLAYAVNGGWHGDVARLENPANGVFFHHFPANDRAPFDPSWARVMTRDYLSSHDGETSTIMLTEGTQWVTTWRTMRVPLVDEEEEKTVRKRNQLAVVWHQEADRDNPDHIGRFINQDLQRKMPDWWLGDGESRFDDALGTLVNYARPGSYHPQGVNMAFCDGRVKFVAETIDYGVYRQLMTSSGADSDDLYNAQNPLNDNKF